MVGRERTGDRPTRAPRVGATAGRGRLLREEAALREVRRARLRRVVAEVPVRTEAPLGAQVPPVGQALPVVSQTAEHPASSSSLVEANRSARPAQSWWSPSADRSRA